MEKGDDTLNKVINVLENEDFPYPAYQSILHQLSSYVSTKADFDSADFIKSLPAQLQPVADELFLSELSIDTLQTTQLAKIIYELKSLSYKHYMTKYGSEDETKVSEYNQRLRNLNKNEIENKLQT